MRYEVLVKPEASEEIVDAARWYESKRIGLGGEFIDAIEHTFDTICSNPKIYKVGYLGSRHALVRRFPYAIHFLIEEHLIIVYGIVHTHRDSEWVRLLFER